MTRVYDALRQQVFHGEHYVERLLSSSEGEAFIVDRAAAVINGYNITIEGLEEEVQKALQAIKEMSKAEIKEGRRT